MRTQFINRQIHRMCLASLHYSISWLYTHSPISRSLRGAGLQALISALRSSLAGRKSSSALLAAEGRVTARDFTSKNTVFVLNLSVTLSDENKQIC